MIVFVDFKSFTALLWIVLLPICLISLSISESDLIICPCCNNLKHQSTVWHHKKRAAQAQAQAPIVQHESFPPLKQHCITHCQADASPSSSGCPQLHAPSFDSDLPLPFLDPPDDLDLPQLPGDACTVPSHHFTDNILLDLHAQTHRNPNENNDNDKDPEDAPEKDANSIDPGTGNFWNEEDIGMEDGVDLHEAITLLWDILTERFIAEAVEFGKFAYSLLHTW